MSAPSAGSMPGLAACDSGDLAREVHDLARRVAAIEQRLAPNGAQTAAIPATPATAAPSAAPQLRVTANVFPLIGKALLGIAGAYVLRALTELGVLSPAAGVTAGLIYALACLWVAARLTVSGTVASTVAALTSVAIMAPLLWEAVTRLNAISAWAASAVLAGFTLIGFALSWSRRLTVVPAIASAGAALVAMALLLATHDLLPFALALLVIAAAEEFEACRGRQMGSRWAAALLADLAVLLLSWVLTRPEGLPEGYVAAPAAAAIAAQISLIAIYGVSAAIRTLVQLRTFSGMETAQTGAALAIGIGGIARMGAGHSTGMLLLGLSALAAGVGSYVVSFVIAAPRSNWNFRAWATFGLFLVLYGTWLPFAGAALWILWCACAAACCWTARIARKPTLGLHGALCLLLATTVSGAAAEASSQLFGAAGARFQWLVAAVVLASALLSWIAIDGSPAGETAHWRRQFSFFAVSAVISFLIAGVAVRSLAGILKAWHEAYRVPADTLATVVLTVICVALAGAAVRSGRRELAWVVYAGMIMTAWKLASCDFPREHNLTLVVSLLFYGCALMVIPPILQRRRAASSTATAAG